MDDDVTLGSPEEIARDFALKWLNRLGGDPLPDDYFTRVDVLYDDRVLPEEDKEFEMILRLESDDDGGAARMFVHFVDEQIRFAAWYFDTTWGEMK